MVRPPRQVLDLDGLFGDEMGWHGRLRGENVIARRPHHFHRSRVRRQGENVFRRRDTHFRISCAADDATIARGIEALRQLARGRPGN
jgi:hypothetical protein